MDPSPVILVVDDDANIRELVSINLLAQGYKVLLAMDGKEGLAAIRDKKPALVVLDVMMPDTDGWEVCKEVKDDPELKDVKVLMLTARGSDKDRMIGREIFGADEYLTKPFDVEELLNTVKRLLHE